MLPQLMFWLRAIYHIKTLTRWPVVFRLMAIIIMGHVKCVHRGLDRISLINIFHQEVVHFFWELRRMFAAQEFCDLLIRFSELHH